jgi:rhodanese-related sulfurtransferase
MNTLIIILAIIMLFAIITWLNNRGISQITAQDAREAANDSETTIFDVRTQQEFQTGHIKGARLFPVSEINGRIDEIISLKDKRILVYCHSGGRSAAACQVLRKHGFTNIMNLKGGITSWINSGFKIAK